MQILPCNKQPVSKPSSASTSTDNLPHKNWTKNAWLEHFHWWYVLTKYKFNVFKITIIPIHYSTTKGRWEEVCLLIPLFYLIQAKSFSVLPYISLIMLFSMHGVLYCIYRTKKSAVSFLSYHRIFFWGVFGNMPGCQDFYFVNYTHLYLPPWPPPLHPISPGQFLSTLSATQEQIAC